MGEKKKKVYNTVIEGARDGLTAEALYIYVRDKHPKASARKIVRASFLALSDPDLRDRSVLDTIYAMAIKHRLDDRDKSDSDDDEDEGETAATDAETAAVATSVKSTKPQKGKSAP